MAKIVKKVLFDTIKNEIALDSFKIRIPLSLVELIHPAFKDELSVINTTTGEIDSDYFKKNSHAIFENGIKIRFAIEEQTTSQNTRLKYLIILINSKILKSSYFEGITQNNIHLVYDELIKLKVANFTFDAFISSEITDVDFKQDYTYKGSHDDFRKMITQLFNATRESKSRDKGCRSYTTKSNMGIEWSKRETIAFKTSPFVKIYHKEIELKNKSSEFANEYLREIDYSDLVRIEATVKNKKHFRTFGVDITALDYILRLDAKVKENIIKTAFKKHIGKILKGKQEP